LEKYYTNTFRNPYHYPRSPAELDAMLHKNRCRRQCISARIFQTPQEI
jgi:hypothetical protein